MRKLQLLAVFGLALGSCATGVVYPRYVVVPSQNLLRGHSASDDLELAKTCEPDPIPTVTPAPAPKLAKCIALKEEVFFQMEKELLELRQALQDCQAGPPPSLR